MIKVVYIGGVGRSGSTVLDIVLGSHPDIISVGELNKVIRYGYINNEYCSCHQPFNSCEFWHPIISAWQAEMGKDVVDDYVRLQTNFERTRNMPKLLAQRFKPSGRFRQYLSANTSLYHHIAENAGKKIIVESSKNMGRCYALSAVEQFDLYVLHLVRDGRGVVHSRQKAFKKDLSAGLQMKYSRKVSNGQQWIGCGVTC